MAKPDIDADMAEQVARSREAMKKKEPTTRDLMSPSEQMKDIKQEKDQAAGEAAAKKQMGTKGFKNGGTASSRADGCAQRGKTRGRIV